MKKRLYGICLVFLMAVLAACGRNVGEKEEKDKKEKDKEKVVEAAGKNNEGKETVTLASGYVSDELKRSIREFNVQNSRYEVVYTEYPSGPERDKLLTELAAGRGPDLIELSFLDVEPCVRKGLLEDLTPWLERDKALSAGDLEETVLECSTVNGCLTAIPPYFAVDTLMGRASELGNEPGWTMDEFMAYVETHPGAEILGGATVGRSDQVIIVMELWCQPDKYMDWETGQAHFDTPEFLKLLSFAADYESKYFDPEKPLSDQLRAGNVLLYNRPITNLKEYLYGRALFENDICYIGYPTAGGEPYYGISHYDTYGMNASSANKEGAWEFVKHMVLAEEEKDYGKERIAYLPTLKRALDNMLGNGRGTPSERPLWRIGDGGTAFDIYPPTEEEIRILRELIDGASGFSFNRSPVESIVLEELEPFFNGGKTAEDVVGVIQSRVQLYMDEMK